MPGRMLAVLGLRYLNRFDGDSRVLSTVQCVLVNMLPSLWLEAFSMVGVVLGLCFVLTTFINQKHAVGVCGLCVAAPLLQGRLLHHCFVRV